MQALMSLADETKEGDTAAIQAKHKCIVDVGEVYSPPRAVTVAEAAALQKGFSFDLTCKRANGKHWDFSLAHCCRDVIGRIWQTRPFLLIGSPPCTA